MVVAGGLGLPPLRPVVHHAHRASASASARSSILYGGARPRELVHRSEVERWQRAPRTSTCRSRSTAPVATGAAASVVVTTLIPRARFDPARAVAMIVGPEVMMRFTVAALRERGVPAERIYVSLERSMKCATAHCGHCMIGPEFVCKDGPVFRYDAVAGWLGVREL